MLSSRVLVLLVVPALMSSPSPTAKAHDLVDAAARGDAVVVDRILQEQPDSLNEADSEGRTALHAAITGKHVTVMESLLKRGADREIKDSRGQTAVALAAQSKSEDLAVQFLRNIPDVDLTEAGKQGDSDTLRLILLGDPAEALGGPRYDRENAYAMVAAAIDNRHFDFLRLLQAAPLDPEDAKWLTDTIASKLCSAAWKGQTDLLRDYIASGSDVNVCDDIWSGTPLHQAVCAGHSELVRILLDAGANVNLNAKGWTTLHAAAHYGRRELAETLLAAGAKVDVAQPWGWRPIHNALWENHLDIVRLLEQRGARIDAWLAAGLGRSDEALRLSEQMPAALSTETPMGEEPAVQGPPPVFWAARCGQLDTLKALWKDDSFVRIELDHKFHQLEGQTLLHVAAGAGQIEVMRWLIERGASIEAAGAEATRDYLSGMTPLHLAAAAGQIEAVKTLLTAGADIEGLTQASRAANAIEAGNVYTPLLAAVIEDKKQMVEFLLDRGADIEAATTSQATALSAAAEHGHRELCELLLARGAKINGKPGACPLLSVAGFRGEAEIVEYLLERGADIDTGARDGHSVLLAALDVRASDRDARRQKIIRLLLARNPSLKNIAARQETSLLLAAVKARQVALVQAALDLGMLAQEKYEDKLLIEASRCGNVATMKLLLAAGLKFRSRGESQYSLNGMKTALEGAIQSGHKDMVRFLLSQGCDPHAPSEIGDETPLCRAVRAGHKLVMLDLLEAGAAGRDEKETAYDCALNLAAENGRADLLHLLLDRRSTLPARTSDPRIITRISNAARNGHTAVVELLLDADANETPMADATALHTAAREGREAMIRRLAARDININIRDQHGRTPLHSALYSASQPSDGESQSLNKAVAVLLELGADPNIADSDNMTPLQLAIVFRRAAVAKNLIAQGATIDIFSAAGLGRIEQLQAALTADPTLLKQSHWYGPPLVWAAAAGQTETARWLLAHDADVNAGRDPKIRRSLSPLSAAVHYGDRAVVELLLSHGADVNAPREDALFVAVDAGCTEIVKLLLEHKASPNHPQADPTDPFGAADCTALHAAARRGYADIAAMLVDHGADIEAKGERRRTPLDAATDDSSAWASPYQRTLKTTPPSRCDLVVILLIDAYRKQDKKPAQDSLDKALCWAAEQGCADVAKELLDAGANVNAKSRNELPPLLCAVFALNANPTNTRSAAVERHDCYMATIRLLMDRGADPHIATRLGDAVKMARDYLHMPDLVDLLNEPNRAAPHGPDTTVEDPTEE